MALKVAERRFIQRIVLADAWNDAPAQYAAWREVGLCDETVGDRAVHAAIERLMARNDAQQCRSTAQQRYDILVRHEARKEEEASLTFEQLSEEARCEALEGVIEAIQKARTDEDMSAAKMGALAQLAKIALAAPAQGAGGVPDDKEAQAAQRKLKQIQRTQELARKARDGGDEDGEPAPDEVPVPDDPSPVRLPVFGPDIPSGRA